MLKKMNLSKSTYMYWQKRLNRANKYEKIEEQIKDIRKDNPSYGYRRIRAMLVRIEITISKKTV